MTLRIMITITMMGSVDDDTEIANANNEASDAVMI
jgi:hypothetical protein